MLVSIIVPIYNTAIYLNKCFDSILHQDIDFAEYEIILVNDGSTDNSLSICNEYAALHSNITIISTTNKGQSAARNRGLEAARGEYVWFIDSDDFIENNCLKYLYSTAKKHSLDILSICADNIDNQTVTRRQEYNDSQLNTVHIGKQFLLFPQYQNCIPFQFFNRNFLIDNNIRLHEGIYHEDNEVLPRVFYAAQRIMVSNSVLYHVNLRPGSTIRSVNPKKAFDLITVSLNLYKYMNTNVIKEDHPLFCNIISNAINGSLQNSLYIDSQNIRKLKQEWFKNRNLFLCMRGSSSKHYRVEGYLFCAFPKHVICLYKIIYTLHSLKNRNKRR